MVAWLVAVGLGVPIMLVAPSEPSARAAGGATPVEALQTPELSALRQRAAEVQRNLLAATASYEAGNARLAQAVARALSQRRVAEAARLRVTVSRQRVDALLRSAYKSGGVSPTLALLFSTGAQDAESLLAGATYLSQVTQNGQDVLREHMRARKVADELTQAAEQAAAEAISQERALAAQVAALRAQAAAARSDLETLVRRLIAEQQARERAAKLARERAAREEARRLAAAQSARAAAAQAAAAQAAAARAAAAQAAAAPVRCGGVSAASVTAWSNYPNGLIPAAALCALSVPGHMLRADAALAYERLAAAYRQGLGRSLCLTDSYRSYEAQVRVYGEKPSLAAVPGTSNHGLGLAVDLCGGLQSFGTPDQAWMRANAGRYGWYHPSWAEPGGSRPEPWHWEYGNIA